ncbi:MAG: DinB family protein [Saprospiraceae bacterium]|nr:DinB family protein [Saprospiraceae bacterium]
METQSTTLASVIDQFHLQTRLFENVVQDFREEHLHERLNGITNHVAWIVGHLVSGRYLAAYVLGVPAREPYPELFAKGKGLDEHTTYPSLAELTKDWPDISEKLLARLETLSERELNAEAPVPSPMTPTNQSLRGFITFISHHEAYHIGQLGILRRYFDLEAMGYG